MNWEVHTVMNGWGKPLHTGVFAASTNEHNPLHGPLLIQYWSDDETIFIVPEEEDGQICPQNWTIT
jgi:hypothetical protein